MGLARLPALSLVWSIPFHRLPPPCYLCLRFRPCGCMSTRANVIYFLVRSLTTFRYFGLYDSVKPLLPQSLQGSFLASFILGFGVTNLAGLASYPVDTVRRRMMMTSGEAVKYKSSADAFRQIVQKEGYKSLFKGAGANVLRAIAGAGVLSGYDQLQVIFFGKAYSGGSG